MKKLILIAFVGLLTVALAGPAVAAMKVGGITFFDFYYLDRDEQSISGGTPQGTVATDNDFNRIVLQNNAINRINARWTNEDNVGMFIELGLGGGDATAAAGGVNATSASLRHAYGWWDVTPTFRIMAGHSTAPFHPLNPSQMLGVSSGTGNVIMNGYGNFYNGRFPQLRVQFKYPNDLGFLRIALIDPHGGASTLPSGAQGTYTIREETTLPRIDVGSPLYFGNIKVYPSFFYQTREIDGAASGVPDDFDSWGVALQATFVTGPFDVRGSIGYGQNWGNTNGGLGVSPASANDQVVFGDQNADGNDDASEDTDCLAWWVDLSVKFGAASPHFIVGQYDVDNDGIGTTVGATDITTTGYVLSVPIDLAKGFRIRPEIGYYDDDDSATVQGTKTDYGTKTIIGVQFQITF